MSTTSRKELLRKHSRLRRGFHITTVHADSEFAPIKPLIEYIPGGPMVNLASVNEHVPEIERRIREVKERCRATRHSLLFQRIHKLVTIHIVLNVVKLLIFPDQGGRIRNFESKDDHVWIMSGEKLDYKKHLSIQIGQYFQVHEEDNPRNSQISQTKGAISLQGDFNFMALNTGKKIIRRSWDVIRMPDLVITRVNALGSDQPRMRFKDRHGHLIGDIEIPGVDADKDDDDHIPGVVSVIAYDINIPGLDVEGPKPQDEVPAPQVEIDDIDIPHGDPAPIEVVPTQAAQAPETPAPVASPAQAHGLRRSTRVRSQANRGVTPSMKCSTYSYSVTQLESQGVLNPGAYMFVQEDFYQAEPDVVAAIMKQLSLKAGL
jgi:hypothetical protein